MNAAFKRLPGLVDAPKHIIGGSENTLKQVELVTQKLEYAHVCRIACIAEIDDNDIMLLTITMAASNALLDTLGIPR